jgi:hypothetical protein
MGNLEIWLRFGGHIPESVPLFSPRRPGRAPPPGPAGGAGWAGAGGGRCRDRSGEVLSKSQPDLQIAHRLLKICIRAYSKQHDEWKARVG